MSKTYPIRDMTLTYSDVVEYLPDVNDEEMENIARTMSNYLMNFWQEALVRAVDLVKQDREEV